MPIPIDLEYDLGLMEKQLRKLAELVEITSPVPIKAQVTDLIRRLQLELKCVRHGLERHLAAPSSEREGAGASDRSTPEIPG